MKKSLHDYLLGVRKETTIVIRTTFALTDELMTKLENHLKRYELVKISSPKKTIHQRYALGFDTPVNSEVYIVTATLGMPVAITSMPEEIGQVLGYSYPKICVHFEGDDLEVINPENAKRVAEINKSDKQIKEYNKEIEKQSNSEVDASEYYGDEYNKNMLKAAIEYRKKQNKEQEKINKDFNKDNKKK